MYVCVCLAVTDSQVTSAIEGGASSVEAVTKRCGAGGDCGSCHEMIEEMIEAKSCVRRRTLPVVTSADSDSAWGLATA